MPDLYLHPSVTSFITDESQYYQAAQGLTKLFMPLFTERGEDNILQYANSEAELLTKVGDLNSIKYGQAILNATEWVKAGGELVFMRCLPEDATYAHSILDFQTKQIDVTKWVVADEDVVREYDSTTDTYLYVLPNGEKVSDEAELLASGAVSVVEPRVLVRPRIKQVNVASTLDAIELYAESLEGLITEDGFTHHILGYFNPKGRGSEYYNDIRFNISVSDTLDDTYDFRVFDVEAYIQNSNGTLQVIDGPFKVSFDPTALDISRESMFISQVLSKYGNEIQFTMIEDGFDSLGEELNPDVNPGLLDPFFLSERNLFDGDTDYHSKNLLSSGITTLAADAVAGSNVLVVSEPELIFPEGKVLVSGIGSYTVEEVDVIQGIVTVTENVAVGGYAEGSIVSASPLDEFRQAGVTNTLDDSTTGTLNVTQTVDANGVAVFVLGSAKFMLDNAGVPVEIDVEITEIDTVGKIITIVPSVTLTTGATSVAVRQIYNSDSDGSYDIDFDSNIVFTGGSTGDLSDSVKDQLLVKAFTGVLNEDILNKKRWPIDLVIDANYSKSVKGACNQLASIIRGDLVFISDVGFTANPQQAIDMRKSLGYSNFYTSIFAQDMIVYDPYAGRDNKVTSTYFICRKIPVVDRENGIHYPFVGPRRGVVAGFDKLSWNPTESWQERLYKAQVNYIVDEPKRTLFMSQLTSQTVASSLSDLSHVRALLRIQRESEDLMSDYQFEFIDKITLDAANYSLNAYLRTWKDNRCCEEIGGVVYSNAYDKKQKIGRVRLELKFTPILERIIINLVVK